MGGEGGEGGGLMGGGGYFDVVLIDFRCTSKHKEKNAVLFRVRKTRIFII